MVCAPGVGDLVFKEPRESAQTKTIGSGDGDDDVSPLAHSSAAVTNADLRATSRARMSGHNDDVAMPTCAERT